MKVLRNPPLTPYLGPYDLTTGVCSEEVFRKLEQQLPRTAFRQWTGLPALSGKAEYRKLGMEVVPRRTFVLDLKQSKEDLWANVYAKRRNDIRKGEADLRIESSFPELKVFMDWQRSAFEAKGKKYPYEHSFLHRVMEASRMHKASLALTAKDADGRQQACVWLVFDHKCMYYLLGATSEKPHRGAVALLLWEAINRAKDMELPFFDFEGSMDPDIADFFRRFGGQEQFYEELQQTQSLLWKCKQWLLG